MNEKRARVIAHGLTCGPHCVLRQCHCVLRQFNSLYQSCPIIKNMFVKVETKSIVLYIVDVMFSKVLEYKDHL